MPSLTRCGLRDRGDVAAVEQHLRPRVGGSTPVSRLTKVVLPAPLGPISAWRAPASSRKSMSRAAASAPKFLLSAAGLEQRHRAHDGAAPDGGSAAASVPTRPRMPLRANSAISTSSRPEPELPGGGIDLRQEMRQRHVGDGADERAVEPAIAAEDQDDEHGRRAIEAERAQVDVGVGLRPEPAGDAGDRRRDRVADDQPPAHRRADRVHAQRVLADAGQALPERRIDQRAHEQRSRRTARPARRDIACRDRAD